MKSFKIFTITFFVTLFFVSTTFFWAKVLPFYHFAKMEFNLSGLDLFAYNSESRSLQLVETRKLHVSWYVYTHESRLVLLASGMQCKIFNGFQVCVTLIMLMFFFFQPFSLLFSCKLLLWTIAVVIHREIFMNFFPLLKKNRRISIFFFLFWTIWF